MFDYNDFDDFSVSFNKSGGGKKKNSCNNRMKKQSKKRLSSSNELFTSKHVRISQAKSENGQQKLKNSYQTRCESNSNSNKTRKSNETRKSQNNK